jgi:hypothetical protein
MGNVTPISQGAVSKSALELRRLRLANDMRNRHAGASAPGQRVFVVLFLDANEHVVSKHTVSARTSQEAVKTLSGHVGPFEVYRWEQVGGQDYVVKGNGVLPPPDLN